MKLKCKLKYKGSYMYNTIRKNVVPNALRWLKNNNVHYKDIEIDNFWEDSWKNNDLGILIDTNPNDLDAEIQSKNIPVVSENETEAEYLNRQKDEQEMREDQLAADRMTEINGQPDSSTLQLEHIEDGVYVYYLVKIMCPNMCLWIKILKCWHFQICFHLVNVALIM